MLISKKDRNERMKSIIRRIFLTLIVFVFAALLFLYSFINFTKLKAPRDSGAPLPAHVTIVVKKNGPRLTIGESWMEKRDFGWVISLAGDRRLIGHNHSILAGRVFSTIDHLWSNKYFALPSGLYAGWFRKKKLRWRMNHLQEVIDSHLLAEIASFSYHLGATKEGIEGFERLLYYEALGDSLALNREKKSQEVFSSAAFALWNRQTANRHMIIGRSMSPFFSMDQTIRENSRALLIYRGEKTLPFVSLARPGAHGVLSGVNAEKILIAGVNIQTDSSWQKGEPLSLLIRYMLEEGRSIEGILAIAKKRPTMGAYALLVADGKKHKAVVIEHSGKKTQLRRADKFERMTLTNHLEHAVFKNDAQNDWVKRYTPSLRRYKRLEQLQKRFSGRFDPATAALLLRTRTGKDDIELGFGHGAAIDSLDADHGLVVDLTAMVLWVFKGPLLLGEMTAIDLKPLLGIEGKTDIPQEISEDGLLSSLDFRRFRLARNQLSYVKKLKRNDELEKALDYAKRAVGLAPKWPKAQRAVADLLWILDRKEQAAIHYREFLKLNPPYKKDIERANQRSHF